MLSGPRSTIRWSRELRREMSLPEKLLWRELRKRPAGLKFRRQHGAGRFTADFFCHKAMLVVEVDGKAHEMGNRPQRDADRDAWFSAHHVRVMRVPSGEVLADLDAVVRGIVHQAGAAS